MAKQNNDCWRRIETVLKDVNMSTNYLAKHIGLLLGAAGVLRHGLLSMHTVCPSNHVETCVQKPLFNCRKMYYIFK